MVLAVTASMLALVPVGDADAEGAAPYAATVDGTAYLHTGFLTALAPAGATVTCADVQV
jgi:hypothetical protein